MTGPQIAQPSPPNRGLPSSWHGAPCRRDGRSRGRSSGPQAWPRCGRGRGSRSHRVGDVAPVFPGAARRSPGAAGQPEEGLRLLTEAQEVVARTDEHFYAAELYRLTGVLQLAQAPAAQAEAEIDMRHALDIARHQQAKSLELRAAMSLSRLWQRQGKRGEARELLAPIYGWFTEGFDTADMQEAQGLLALSPRENKTMIETPSSTLRGHFQEFFCHVSPNGRWR